MRGGRATRVVGALSITLILTSCGDDSRSGSDDGGEPLAPVTTTTATDGAVVVPQLEGLCLDEARLAADAIPVVLDGVALDAIGLVESQQPKAGAPIRFGGSVRIEVADDPSCR